MFVLLNLNPVSKMSLSFCPVGTLSCVQVSTRMKSVIWKFTAVPQHDTTTTMLQNCYIVLRFEILTLTPPNVFPAICLKSLAILDSSDHKTPEYLWFIGKYE